MTVLSGFLTCKITGAPMGSGSISKTAEIYVASKTIVSKVMIVLENESKNFNIRTYVRKKAKSPY